MKCGQGVRATAPCKAGVVVAVTEAFEVGIGPKTTGLLAVVTFPVETAVDGVASDVRVVLHTDAAAITGSPRAPAGRAGTTSPVIAPNPKVAPGPEMVGVAGLTGPAACHGSAASLGLVMAQTTRAGKAAGLLVSLAARTVVAAGLAVTAAEGRPLRPPDTVEPALHDVVTSVVRVPGGRSFGVTPSATDVAVPQTGAETAGAVVPLATVSEALERRGEPTTGQVGEVGLTSASEAARVSVTVVRAPLTVPARQPRAVTTQAPSSSLRPTMTRVGFAASLPRPVPPVT